MAEETGELTLALSSEVLSAIDSIWEYSATTHSPSSANNYVAFILRSLEQLPTTYRSCNFIDPNRKHRFLLIKRPGATHGHVAVFRIEANRIEVLNLYHTAQDW